MSGGHFTRGASLSRWKVLVGLRAGLVILRAIKLANNKPRGYRHFVLFLFANFKTSFELSLKKRTTPNGVVY